MEPIMFLLFVLGAVALVFGINILRKIPQQLKSGKTKIILRHGSFDDEIEREKNPKLFLFAIVMNSWRGILATIVGVLFTVGILLIFLTELFK